jgi:thiol-disulfide isomerase/thioredoxin
MKLLQNTLPVMLLAVLSFSTQAQVGNPAPNFTVTDTYGNTHTLYDYLDSGKVVVLDFFFTTCIPCQFYSPQVNLAYEKYGCNTANVIFMSIDYHDTDAEVLAYDEEYNIEYPSVSGLNGGGDAVVSLYGVFAFPTFYVIDSSKTIVEQIDPPTLQVFEYRFGQLGILPAECIVSAVKETVATERIEIFPNPFAGSSLNVRLPGGVAVSGNFEIMDCTGRTVRSGRLEISSDQVVEVPLGDLPSGVFLLKINALKEGKTYRGRFVKE